MINFKGAGKLQDLFQMFDQPDEARQLISEALADESLELIQEGFSKQSDPYGRAWAPRKKPDYRPGKPLLIHTGQLKGSWRTVKVTPAGFVVRSEIEGGTGRGAQYSTYLQEGTSFMPARPMVPTKGQGLPASWEQDYNDAAIDALEEWLK